MAAGSDRLWDQVNQVMERRRGWALEPQSSPGAPALWCLSSDWEYQLSVGVEGQAISVFLVDDDEDVLFLMTRVLRKGGVREVKSFAGGEASLQALRSGDAPDLIILDQNMPGMNGSGTLALIRRLRPDVPVLISSGQSGLEEWPEFNRPWVGVISKPFTMGEIQAKLAQFGG